MKELVAIFIALSALIIGSITDLKKREVPDWLNYGLMFVGFALALIAGIIDNDFAYFLESAVGFIFFFLLGSLLFYTGQWGGGDTKMLMGLGALVGIELSFKIPQNIQDAPFMIIFVGLTLVSGAFYGTLWTIFMAFKNRRLFIEEFKKRLSAKWIIFLKYLCLLLVFIVAIVFWTIDDLLLKMSFLLIGVSIPLLFYLSIAIKSIEKVCMIKKVSPSSLTEGDWIEEEIMGDKTKVFGKKVLSESDIKKIKKIKSKYYVDVKRKFLIIRLKKRVHIRLLKTGDILLEKIDSPLKLNSGLLKKSDIDRVKNIGLYTFNTPKIRKSFMFMTYKTEFDEDSVKAGDELLNDLYFGEYISGPKDLGISKQNIARLVKYQKENKIKQVTIKEGIPFVPSFLIAFIATIFLFYL
ncbi:MAG: prepilin peptidase [Nanobdellota archaeon]